MCILCIYQRIGAYSNLYGTIFGNDILRIYIYSALHSALHFVFAFYFAFRFVISPRISLLHTASDFALYFAFSFASHSALQFKGCSSLHSALRSAFYPST
jgi:disulfide bond formation protein DsbB